MDIKQMLGEELFAQVSEKLGDNKIAVVSDGNWFPKAKFDEKNNRVKELETQLGERDTQLAELKKAAGSNEELSKKIKELEELNQKTQQDYEAKMQQQHKDFAIEQAIKDAKAKNPKAVKALLDLEAVKLDGDKLLGLNEQLGALAKSDAYLFGEDAPGGTGANPAGGGNKPKNIREQYDQAVQDAYKNPNDMALRQKVFLLKEQLFKKE